MKRILGGLLLAALFSIAVVAQIAIDRPQSPAKTDELRQTDGFTIDGLVFEYEPLFKGQEDAARLDLARKAFESAGLKVGGKFSLTLWRKGIGNLDKALPGHACQYLFSAQDKRLTLRIQILPPVTSIVAEPVAMQGEIGRAHV